jgi:hypothetical protein
MLKRAHKANKVQIRRENTGQLCRVDDVFFIHLRASIGGWIQRHPPYWLAQASWTSSAGTMRMPARRPFFTLGLGKMIRAPGSSTTQRVSARSSANK